jgi:DNA-binding IclR family transcriptional regulator
VRTPYISFCIGFKVRDRETGNNSVSDGLERAGPMSGKRDYTVSAVDRALNVLETLAEHPDIGVTEIAQRMGATKSLVFRLLQTLEARGFIDKDPNRSSYTLGYRMLYFGQRTEGQKLLISTSALILDELCVKADENIILIVRNGLNSLIVATRESRHQMRLFAQAGRRGPLHAGGASALLLAYAPIDIQNAVLAGPLESYTNHTLTDPQALRQRWADIRAIGYYVVNGDLDDGAFSIAAPIRDHSGDVVAAISIAGPVSRLGRTRQQQHIERIRSAATALSVRLGHREPAIG